MTEQITRKSLFRVIAWILVFCMMLTIFPLGARAEGATTQSVQRTTITDPATNSQTDYVDILGAADSTQYDGRVWVDKTVSDKNVKFTGDDDTKTFSVSKDEDEDFLVTYSALANTSGLQIVPEDKVSDTIFVLDFSMTMNRNMDGNNPVKGENGYDADALSDTRIYSMLNAMDETIYNLKQANDQNRVGIVTFYGKADVLLSLTEASSIAEAVTGPEEGTQVNVSGKDRTVNYTTPHEYFSILGYDEANGDATNKKSWVQCNIPELSTIGELAGWTNMQGGLYEALDMLREKAPEQEFERQANVIVISDGASNAISKAVEDQEWYKAMDTEDYITASLDNSGINFATALTAAYLKAVMASRYSDCSIYTVGLTTAANKQEMEALLNPGNEIENNSYWQDYNNRDENYPEVGSVTFEPVTDDAGNIIPASLQYADKFYNAQTASQLADAFQEITSNIIVSEPKPPTETDGGDPTKSGYITFTDPLGKYMEVKDVKCIIFDDQKFEKPTKKLLDDGKTTRYTFSGKVDNPASSNAYVEDILIDVTQTDDAHQTVKIQIPASVVPLRSNTVYLKSGDSTPIQLKTKEHYPMRIVYSVGLQEQVTQEWLEEKDPYYLKKNMTTDATGNRVVNFYANLFDEENKVMDDDGTKKTLGNATATFTAGTSNPFYYAQKGSVLYVDEDGKKVPAKETFASRTTYYVKHDYYYYYKEDNKLKHGETWLGRSDLTADNVEADEKTHLLVLKEDMLKQVNLASARTEKTDAVENTADYSYYAKALDETEQVAKGSFLAYLGNNGKLSLKLSEPSEPEEPLTIHVEKVWNDQNNQDNLRPPTITVSLLKNGEDTGLTLVLNEENGWKGTFVIKDYDEDAKYTVQEQPVPDGYKCVVTGNAENGFTITNTHSPKPDPVPDDPDPGEDDDPPDTPDDLNTVDHYLYIEGYPEDYRTGEESWDESVWPVKPQGNITRAEVATIFYRLLKDEVREEIETDVNNFPDVNEGDWFNVTVSSLANMGAVGGYEDGTFRPNEPITRAELSAMAVRFFAAFETIYEPGTFTDVTGDEWYATAIAAAKELGIIGGYPDGSMRPEANITRAETCAIVNRVINRHPHEEHLGDVEDMRTWPDNLPGAWYYADMQEATNGHYYEWIKIDGAKFEEWTEVDKDYDWTKR